MREALPGGSLQALLEARRRLPFAARAAILRGIAAGVRFLHEARPPVLAALTPGSVLLDKNLQAKLCVPPRARGAPPPPLSLWTAPECLGGAPLSLESDVYAFGMVVFELLSNTRPFAAQEATMGRDAVLNLIASMDARPMFPAATPQPLREVAMECWVRNPSKRPSAAESALLLESALLQMGDGGDSSVVGLGDLDPVSVLPKHILQALKAGQKVEPESFEEVLAHRAPTLRLA